MSILLLLGNVFNYPFIESCHFSPHSLHLYSNLSPFSPAKLHSKLILFLSTHFLFFFLFFFVHTLLIQTPDKLSTRSDNEADINLKLSINLSLCVIVLSSSRFFLIHTEKVIYFSIFSPIQSSSPLNSSAN